jgi:hypothetical protein
MVGMAPIFYYKIPVTANLVCDVRPDAYSSATTIVSVHNPHLPTPALRSEGMRPLDNRQAILRCFEAFKGVVDL